MITNLDYGNKLFGFYRGIVLKHLDHGKCKVFIYGVYHDSWQTKPDLLPDAEPAMGIFGGSLDYNGTFSYPNINSMVWCFFANGDQNIPVYFLAIPGGLKSDKVFDSIRPDVHKVIAGTTEFKMEEPGLIQIKAESQNLDSKVDVKSEGSKREQYKDENPSLTNQEINSASTLNILNENDTNNLELTSDISNNDIDNTKEELLNIWDSVLTLSQQEVLDNNPKYLNYSTNQNITNDQVNDYLIETAINNYKTNNIDDTDDSDDTTNQNPGFIEVPVFKDNKPIKVDVELNNKYNKEILNYRYVMPISEDMLKIYGSLLSDDYWWKLVSMFRNDFIYPYKSGYINSPITNTPLFKTIYEELSFDEITNLINKFDKKKSITADVKWNTLSYVNKKINLDNDWAEYKKENNPKAYSTMNNEYIQYKAVRYVLEELRYVINIPEAKNKSSINITKDPYHILDEQLNNPKTIKQIIESKIKAIDNNSIGLINDTDDSSSSNQIQTEEPKEEVLPSNKSGITGKIAVEIKQNQGSITKEEILHEILNHATKTYAKIILNSLCGGAGFIKIDTDGKIILTASEIALIANKISVLGSSLVDVASSTVNISGGTSNINGGGGDCVISNISLCKHKHPCAHGPTGSSIP